MVPQNHFIDYKMEKGDSRKDVHVVQWCKLSACQIIRIKHRMTIAIMISAINFAKHSHAKNRMVYHNAGGHLRYDKFIIIMATILIISQLVYTIDLITCNWAAVCIMLVKISREIKETANYVVEWYNSIGLFNKQTYIVLVNPIMISF